MLTDFVALHFNQSLTIKGGLGGKLKRINSCGSVASAQELTTATSTAISAFKSILTQETTQRRMAKSGSNVRAARNGNTLNVRSRKATPSYLN